MGEEVSLIDNTQQESSPLKEGREDIISLAEYFIKIAKEQISSGHTGLSKEVEEHLLSHDWRGSEKELEDAIRKACISSDNQSFKIEDFDLKHGQIKSIGIGRFIEEKLKGFMRNIKNLEKFNLYETVIPQVEKALILMVMKETGGNQTKTAKLLGINRNTLRDKIKKLKISVKS